MAFEKMLSELSATFINLPEEQVGATIENSLGRVAEFLKLNTITLFGYSQENKELTVTCSWRAEEVQPVPAVMRAEQFSWITNRLLRGETVLATDLEVLPADASAEREFLRALGARFGRDCAVKGGGPIVRRHFIYQYEASCSVDRRACRTAQIVSRNLLECPNASTCAGSRFRHAAIVESSDDAIVSKSLDGIIMSWNAAAQRVFGFSEAEALGQPISVLIPQELRHEEDAFLQRLKAGEHVEHCETVRIAKDGKRVSVSLTISPVRNSAGKIVGFSQITRDITDRKRAEQVLARK